jgi:arylformamidase
MLFKKCAFDGGFVIQNQPKPTLYSMEQKINIIDISLPLYEGMLTYPDNIALSFRPEQGPATIRTVITIGSHAGTHIDAPKHALDKGMSVDAISLDKFIGKCRVIDCTEPDFGQAVGVELMRTVGIGSGEKILLKTRNSARGFEKFYDDYIYLDGDAAEYLAGLNVDIVGIDSLSIKQRGSMDQRPHTALLERNIIILEGLDLSQVSPGEYLLCALPLKLIGLDGSPCRAVLIQD